MIGIKLPVIRSENQPRIQLGEKRKPAMPVEAPAETPVNLPNDGYHAYQLRIWRAETNSDHWRILLEDTVTGERQAFATLEKLIEFIESLGKAGE